jgi:hypothetical protein
MRLIVRGTCADSASRAQRPKHEVSRGPEARRNARSTRLSAGSGLIAMRRSARGGRGWGGDGCYTGVADRSHRDARVSGARRTATTCGLGCDVDLIYGDR